MLITCPLTTNRLQTIPRSIVIFLVPRWWILFHLVICIKVIPGKGYGDKNNVYRNEKSNSLYQYWSTNYNTVFKVYLFPASCDFYLYSQLLKTESVIMYKLIVFNHNEVWSILLKSMWCFMVNINFVSMATLPQDTDLILILI